MSLASKGSFNSSHIVFSVLCIGFAVSTTLLIRWRKNDEIKRRLRQKRTKDEEGSGVNVGCIFGMDVGGTLTKIVYFEAKLEDDATTATDVIDSIACKTHDIGTSSLQLPDRMIRSQTMDGQSSLPKLAESSTAAAAEGSSNSITQPSMKRSISSNNHLIASTMKRSNSIGNLNTPDHQEALQKIYNFMDATRKIPSVTVRDDILSFYSSVLGGRLHFLLFETRNMMTAINLLSSQAVTENIRTVGCTGGGAHKYASEFQEQLGITVTQQDELGCLIRGMHFALTNINGECYSYRNENLCGTDSVDDDDDDADSDTTSDTDVAGPASSSSKKTEDNEKSWQKDVKEHTVKVTIPYDPTSDTHQFPYLLVNIGSGVSILKVTSPGTFERVSGSSLGGGTYWGLCRLLTKCATFEDVIDIAESGDATEVDMLVRDIYGGDYDHMNLRGSMVASSFGKLVMKESPRDGVREEDLAIALLMMITNNIGQVSYLNAQVHKCSKIFFVGTFLRHNPISCRRLAFAIDFWSKGCMEALFLSHEGYFGALGTFLLSAYGQEGCDEILNLNKQHKEGESSSDSSGGNDGSSSSSNNIRSSNSSDSIHGSASKDKGNSSSSSSSGSSSSGSGSRHNNKVINDVFGISAEFLQKIRDWRPMDIGKKKEAEAAAAAAPTAVAASNVSSSSSGGRYNYRERNTISVGNVNELKSIYQVRSDNNTSVGDDSNMYTYASDDDEKDFLISTNMYTNTSRTDQFGQSYNRSKRSLSADVQD